MQVPVPDACSLDFSFENKLCLNGTIIANLSTTPGPSCTAQHGMPCKQANNDQTPALWRLISVLSLALFVCRHKGYSCIHGSRYRRGGKSTQAQPASRHGWGGRGPGIRNPPSLAGNSVFTLGCKSCLKAKGCVGFGQISDGSHGSHGFGGQWVLFGPPLLKVPFQSGRCPEGFQIGKMAPPPKPPQQPLA